MLMAADQACCAKAQACCARGTTRAAVRSASALGEITDLYCEKTGRSGVPDLNWYFAYNLFRLVGIVQGIRKRIIDGNASSAEAERTAARVVPLAQQAGAFAQQA